MNSEELVKPTSVSRSWQKRYKIFESFSSPSFQSQLEDTHDLGSTISSAAISKSIRPAEEFIRQSTTMAPESSHWWDHPKEHSFLKFPSFFSPKSQHQDTHIQNSTTSISNPTAPSEEPIQKPPTMAPQGPYWYSPKERPGPESKQ